MVDKNPILLRKGNFYCCNVIRIDARASDDETSKYRAFVNITISAYNAIDSFPKRIVVMTDPDDGEDDTDSLEEGNNDSDEATKSTVTMTMAMMKVVNGR